MWELGSNFRLDMRVNCDTLGMIRFQ